MKIHVIIYAQPTPKARPRVTVIGGHAHAYTPKNTRDAESMIKAMIRTQVMKCGQFPPGTPIRLEATFYLERPKSIPKKVLLPIKKPDVDNYFKLLMDSLEKFVYPADSQITCAYIRKRYGFPPHIELSIGEDEL